MAASKNKYKQPITGPSEAKRNMDALMEEDRKKQAGYGHTRGTEAKGKRGSLYEIEVFKAQWHPVAEANARGSKELAAEKKRLTGGLKRGSYRVKVYNKTTGKEVMRGGTK